MNKQPTRAPMAPGLRLLLGMWLIALASVSGSARAQSAMDGFLPAPNLTVRAIAVASDGYILAGGDFTQIAGVSRRALARVRADGSIDGGFNPLIGNGEVHAIAVQADGRILIGGTFTQIGVSQRLRIARLHPDGSLDAGFNPGASDTVRALLIQADGSILAGGDFTQLGGQTRNRIARIFATGTLDASFQPSANGSVLALAVLPDGRIWLGGDFTQIGPFPRSRLARLHPDGSLDQSQTRTVNATVRSIVVDIDGSTLIGGDFTEILVAIGPSVTRNRLARIGADDHLTPFNPGSDGTVEAITVMPNGEVVVGGLFTTISGLARRNLVRVSVTGTPESFGYVYRPNGRVNALAVDATGSLLIGGSFTADFGGLGPFVPRLARFQDPNFVDQSHGPAEPNNTVLALAGDRHGRMLVGGSFSVFGGVPRTLTARVFGSTTPDTFDPDIGGGAAVQAITVLQDGDILLGGSFATVDGLSRPNLVRLFSFSITPTEFNPAPNGSVRAISVQPDGKLLVAGSFTSIAGQSRHRLARLHPNGSLDTDFINPQIDADVSTLALQADGRIIIGGQFGQVGGQPRQHIARLNADGSLDMGFDPGANGPVGALALDAQGRILVGGQFNTLGGQPRDHLARLMPSGSVDPTFSPQMGNWVTSIAPLVDGRIMVTGAFMDVDDITRMGTARLLADGSVDLGFEANATMPTVHAMSVYPEGKIMVGGDFTTLAGTTMPRLGRLSVPEPVVSKLELSGETVTWHRAGVAPEVAYAPELWFSPEGISFAPIAVMQRVQDGWEVEGFEQPVGEIFYLQVRAPVTSGLGNGSLGRFHVTRRFFGMPPELIMADGFESP